MLARGRRSAARAKILIMMYASLDRCGSMTQVNNRPNKPYRRQADRLLGLGVSVPSPWIRQIAAMMELFRRSRGVALSLALAGAVFAMAATRSSAHDEAVNEDFSAHRHDGRGAQDHDRAERARGELRPLVEIMPLVCDRITGEVANIDLSATTEFGSTSSS